MTAARWRLLHGTVEVGPFPAPEQTDPIVTGLRNAWAAGDLAEGCVTIQVDHGGGGGWETYEFINFAEESAA